MRLLILVPNFIDRLRCDFITVWILKLMYKNGLNFIQFSFCLEDAHLHPKEIYVLKCHGYFEQTYYLTKCSMISQWYLVCNWGKVLNKLLTFYYYNRVHIDQINDQSRVTHKVFFNYLNSYLLTIKSSWANQKNI